MLQTLRFSLQNVIYFIMLPFLVPILFTFYIQDVLKFKCKTRVPKGWLRKIIKLDTTEGLSTEIQTGQLERGEKFLKVTVTYCLVCFLRVVFLFKLIYSIVSTLFMIIFSSAFCKLYVYGSMHRNTNLIEMPNKMQLCRTNYYSVVS
jgi:hypothetical protein